MSDIVERLRISHEGMCEERYPGFDPEQIPSVQMDARTTITELRAERDRLAGEVERMRKALGQWDALIEELPSGEDGLTGKQVDRMCRIFNEARARAALQGETK